jgi:hypothetical protein
MQVPTHKEYSSSALTSAEALLGIITQVLVSHPETRDPEPET